MCISRGVFLKALPFYFSVETIISKEFYHCISLLNQENVKRCQQEKKAEERKKQQEMLKKKKPAGGKEIFGSEQEDGSIIDVLLKDIRKVCSGTLTEKCGVPQGAVLAHYWLKGSIESQTDH